MENESEGLEGRDLIINREGEFREGGCEGNIICFMLT
jgi:hypothetical protein